MSCFIGLNRSDLKCGLVLSQLLTRCSPRRFKSVLTPVSSGLRLFLLPRDPNERWGRWTRWRSANMTPLFCSLSLSALSFCDILTSMFRGTMRLRARIPPGKKCSMDEYLKINVAGILKVMPFWRLSVLFSFRISALPEHFFSRDSCQKAWFGFTWDESCKMTKHVRSSNPLVLPFLLNLYRMGQRTYNARKIMIDQEWAPKTLGLLKDFEEIFFRCASASGCMCALSCYFHLFAECSGLKDSRPRRAVGSRGLSNWSPI